MPITRLLFALVLLFLFACEGPAIDSNWREKEDFVGPNGQVITGEQAEEAGLVIYNMLQFLLKEESFDTLDVVSAPLPWAKLEEESLNLPLLSEIKNGFTFTNRTNAFERNIAYPTFFYSIGVFSDQVKSIQGGNSRWMMKNHTYGFTDAAGKAVDVSFFIDPVTLKIHIKNRTFYKDNVSTQEFEYYTEIQYKPEDKNAVIAAGNVSFEIHARTGYEKVEINAASKGKTIELKDGTVTVRDFQPGFAVFETSAPPSTGFGVIGIAADGNQYRTKPDKKVLALYGGKSGKMNVSKIVWEYVESQDYEIEKEPFLHWFATEILTKHTPYSQEEKEAQYVVAYSIGEMNSMLLYSVNVEKLMDFSMELK